MTERHIGRSLQKLIGTIKEEPAEAGSFFILVGLRRFRSQSKPFKWDAGFDFFDPSAI